MSLPNRPTIFSTLPVVLAAVCLCNCSTPIAPGYRIAKESRDVQFVAGSPPAIQVESKYTIVNYGAANLDFIDVTLPVASAYGRGELKSELDGHAATLSALPSELQVDSPDQLRLSFDSAWKQGQSHQLTIDYSFRSPEAGSRITLDDSDFHLGSRGAFAVLEPPKHILSPFPKRPAKIYYSVRVPDDFRVLARGTLAGRKEIPGGETEYRYRLLAGDLTPFVVAGRYTESAPSGDEGAIFWTLQPVSIAPATAQAIGNAWNTLQKDFGPLDRNIHAPHIVEVPNLPEHISGEQGVAAVAFPGGALVSSAALVQAQSDAFIEAVSHALAHNWLGDEIYPAADASLVLGEGLPEYAMLAIDEDRGGEALRRKRIMRYLAAYDSALGQGGEETLAVATLNDPRPARRIALAKAPLFFAALEDECGQDKMRAGVKEIVTLLRGQEVGYPALRSALEQISGKNLAPTFRLWLNEKGIPADFRARYGANPPGMPARAQ